MPWNNPYFGRPNSHNKDGQVALFDDLVARFPQYITKEIIGQSFLGVPLPMYRVGNAAGAVTDGPLVDPQKYYFRQWQDGDTNLTKTVTV